MAKKRAKSNTKDKRTRTKPSERAKKRMTKKNDDFVTMIGFKKSKKVKF